jgi:YtkA-like
MKTFTHAHAFAAALIAVAIGSASTAALADIKDYKFELVDQTVQAGPDKVITVRLVNTKTGKPVPDAVIFATRLDMAPDGMQEMATKIVPVPDSEPGIYRFKATVSMAGRWQLSLGAKVQGETGTIEDKLVITAQK